MSVPEKVQIGMVDLTPTWASMVAVYVDLIESGKAEQRSNALSELRRMAQAADNWVTHYKKEQGK